VKTKLDIIVLETHFVGGVDEGGNLVVEIAEKNLMAVTCFGMHHLRFLKQVPTDRGTSRLRDDRVR